MWKNNDGLLTTWLRSMMNEDVLSMVIGLQTAQEIWLTVEENMLPATKEQETWLKDSLYSLKKGSSKLDEFLKKFKGLCDKLAAIGKPMNDDDKIFQIARALGPKYADFKTAMLTKPPYPSLKKFINALQNHEHTVIVEKDEEARLGTNQNQAFFGQRGRGRNQRGGRPPYRGRGSQRNSGENNTSDEEVICQICHKRKHSAAECWYRYDYDNEEDPHALAAMNLQENNDQQFYENKVLAKGSKQGKLYTLEGDFHAAFNAIQGESSGFSLWHKRLGHANPKILEALKRNNFIDFSSWSKAPRICCFLKFQKQVEKQLDKKITIFQSDGGGEFNSTAFIKHLENCGITRQISCPYTPEQNGVAERKHRHINETALTMMFHASLPLKLWVDSFLAATYIINRLPLSPLKNKSPYEILFKKLPDYRGLKEHSTLTTFPQQDEWLPKNSPNCENLNDSRAVKVNNCKGATISTPHVQFMPHKDVNLDNNSNATSPIISDFPQDNLEDNLNSATPHDKSEAIPNILESPHAMQPLTTNDSNSSSSHATEPPNLSRNTDNSPATNSQPDYPDISNRLFVELKIPNTAAEPQNLNTHPMMTRNKLKQNPKLALQASHSREIEPKTLKTALKNPLWTQAMKEELQALHQNQTWVLVPRPNNVNVIGSKWVYRIKYRENGTIDRYKARLVAKGFTQVPGVDFDETFSPVIKATTIRLILAIAVSSKWLIKQLDVRNAFLHGLLKEIVYMEQPPGFRNSRHPTYYTKDLLSKARMQDCSPINTPMAIRSIPCSDDNEPVDATEYRGLVGSLQYLTYTRPDITFAVNRKQHTVSRSSAEAEYRSMASAAAELTWLTYLLNDIGFCIPKAPTLLCDNLSAIHMTKNPVFHARMKHIELDVHFVREKVAKGSLFTRYVPSHLQIADTLTKPLGKHQFLTLRTKLGVHRMSLPSLRGADKDKSQATNMVACTAMARGFPTSRLSHN
ncbi:retrovirus-related pol polyprotein from transposon RE1 [Citrus sinensis]|uniref:Retrovirus-related pol polyprotein from transposon RE1 n=1 Tax=Citrus sinensis TaxID=2711 RepID=A0ACB8N7T8_CITSI|nr:retrovirus-related pol polyprotein from transposon RE1 [Citrus sinensis]